LRIGARIFTTPPDIFIRQCNAVLYFATKRSNPSRIRQHFLEIAAIQTKPTGTGTGTGTGIPQHFVTKKTSQTGKSVMG
jgi:hypothetical protein